MVESNSESSLRTNTTSAGGSESPPSVQGAQHKPFPPRSRNGCSTCRQRKVRCDERQPICGQCERLRRNCTWEKVFTFRDVNRRVFRDNQNVDATTSPVWSQNIEGNRPTSIPANETTDTGETSMPVRPDSGSSVSFATLTSENLAHLSSPDLQQAFEFPDRRWDSIVDLQDTGGAAAKKLRKTGLGGPLQVLGKRDAREKSTVDRLDDEHWPSSMRDMIDPEVQESNTTWVRRPLPQPKIGSYSKITDLYLTNTKPAILPLGSQLSLLSTSRGQDAILSDAESWPPLQHALCALTTLHLALKQNSYLLQSAFQHYHRAVELSKSRSQGSRPFERLFLHFLLLLHDISCASELQSNSSRPWALHFDCIASLIREQPELTQTSSNPGSFIVEYVVYLDAQACLAGTVGAGSCLDAFLDSRPLRRGSSASKPYGREEYAPVMKPSGTAVERVARLSGSVAVLYARLARFASYCHASSTKPMMSTETMRKEKVEFQLRLKQTWKDFYPPDLPTHPLAATTVLPPFTKTLLSFAIMQYSTAMLYLHTCILQFDREQTEHEVSETAFFCTLILKLAQSAAGRGFAANHHLILPIFLAGINTYASTEKALAWKLLKVYEDAGIGPNARKTLAFFEKILALQGERRSTGCDQSGIDWIALAAQEGIIMVNMGL
ncbi:Fungal specific transcription factor domain-containing protein 73 [Elsinoe fawcettii]|nr:Fungal specific transcription factor domain-containing protein 73 [Elsinoe fawcettii]